MIMKIRPADAVRGGRVFPSEAAETKADTELDFQYFHFRDSFFEEIGEQ